MAPLKKTAPFDSGAAKRSGTFSRTVLVVSEPDIRVLNITEQWVLGSDKLSALTIVGSVSHTPIGPWVILADMT